MKHILGLRAIARDTIRLPQKFGSVGKKELQGLGLLGQAYHHMSLLMPLVICLGGKRPRLLRSIRKYCRIVAEASHCTPVEVPAAVEV
ncbi:hypothetical protein GCM10009075_32330 [Sphingomonas trueperi]